MIIKKNLAFLGFVSSLGFTDRGSVNYLSCEFRSALDSGDPQMGLFCDGAGKAIYIIPWKSAEAIEVPSGQRKTKKIWSDWSGFEPDSAYKLRTRTDRLYTVGKIAEIVYDSDKFSGTLERYKHTAELDPVPNICCSSKAGSGGPQWKPSGDARKCWGIVDPRGRKLVSSRGLIF